MSESRWRKCGLIRPSISTLISANCWSIKDFLLHLLLLFDFLDLRGSNSVDLLKRRLDGRSRCSRYDYFDTKSDWSRITRVLQSFPIEWNTLLNSLRRLNVSTHVAQVCFFFLRPMHLEVVKRPKKRPGRKLRILKWVKRKWYYIIRAKCIAWLHLKHGNWVSKESGIRQSLYNWTHVIIRTLQRVRTRQNTLYPCYSSLRRHSVEYAVQFDRA